MKTALILACTALCLSLAAASQAQKLTLTAARSGIIPAGGGTVGIRGEIANTTSQMLTITNDSFFVQGGSETNDYILVNNPTPLVIAPNSSYFGQIDTSVTNQDMNGMALSDNKTALYLFTASYGMSSPTFVSEGYITLDYTFSDVGTGANAQTFTGVQFNFPAAAVTPEPGTLALLGSGMVSGGLLLARRRRK